METASNPHIRDHIDNPRNASPLSDPDGIGETGGMVSRNWIEMAFSLDEHGVIKEIGCRAAAPGPISACGSVLTECVLGMTLDAAANVGVDQIARSLEMDPPAIRHAAMFPVEALRAAIRNYRQRTTPADPSDDAVDGGILCYCFKIPRNEVVRLVCEYALTDDQLVTDLCKAGGGCGSCRPDIKAIIEEYR